MKKWIVEDSFLDKVDKLLQAIEDMDRETIQTPRWHVAMTLESLYREMYSAADQVEAQLECGFDEYKEDGK